jgi:hypothetical protein
MEHPRKEKKASAASSDGGSGHWKENKGRTHTLCETRLKNGKNTQENIVGSA